MLCCTRIATQWLEESGGGPCWQGEHELKQRISMPAALRPFKQHGQRSQQRAQKRGLRACSLACCLATAHDIVQHLELDSLLYEKVVRQVFQ